jgi:AcrR family transcriptional regulator
MSRTRELLPILVAAFAELGYRRATTAMLARRCQVQEMALYRIWPDKKAMFVAAIDYVAENSLRIYRELLREAGEQANPVEVLLAYESSHIGEFGNYRIVFSALPESDDPDIRQALQRMYHRIHGFVVEIVARGDNGGRLDAVKIAWGLMGLGTMMTILDGLGLVAADEREELFGYVSRRLVGLGR